MEDDGLERDDGDPDELYQDPPQKWASRMTKSKALQSMDSNSLFGMPAIGDKLSENGALLAGVFLPMQNTYEVKHSESFKNRALITPRGNIQVRQRNGQFGKLLYTQEDVTHLAETVVGFLVENLEHENLNLNGENGSTGTLLKAVKDAKITPMFDGQNVGVIISIAQNGEMRPIRVDDNGVEWGKPELVAVYAPLIFFGRSAWWQEQPMKFFYRGRYFRRTAISGSVPHNPFLFTSEQSDDFAELIREQMQIRLSGG